MADFASTVFQNQASHIEERIALFDIADIKYGKGLAKNELVEDGYPVFGGNGQIGFYSKYLYEEPQIIIYQAVGLFVAFVVRPDWPLNFMSGSVNIFSLVTVTYAKQIWDGRICPKDTKEEESCRLVVTVIEVGSKN